MACSFDVGTYNFVFCRKDDKGNFVYRREVNAFIELPIENRFVFEMMRKSNVPLIENKETKTGYALGESAVSLAYTMNQIELKRPMKDGCLNPKEKNAQQIMSIMVHSLIGELKDKKETLYYSVPANSINNNNTDSDYHSLVLKAIFDAFEDDKGNKVNAFPINEGLALCYAELQSKNNTGLGISFGAGQINICFAIFGVPVFQFSIVNSGDWIDNQAAKATGESPTFINQEKLKLDLTINPDSMIQRAIKGQYEIMINKTVSEIKKGIEQAGNKARTGKPISIVISGGTSSPKGFKELFEKTTKEANLPIEIGEIIQPKDPLYSVARGCALAAEASNQ